MGVILDSSIVIQAERRGETEVALIERIGHTTGDQSLGFSAIGLTEILHGIYRAKTVEIRDRRELFLRHLIEDFPVYAYTEEIAEFAGRIGGQQAAIGNTIPFTDLLIGATAISLGFSVLTVNVRHFQMIPGLKVTSF